MKHCRRVQTTTLHRKTTFLDGHQTTTHILRAFSTFYTYQNLAHSDIINVETAGLREDGDYKINTIHPVKKASNIKGLRISSLNYMNPKKQTKESHVNIYSL